MRPQDWACVPVEAGHECDSVLDVRGHALKLKTAEESALARHLCEVHNATVFEMVKSFDEAMVMVRETTVSKEDAEAAISQAVAQQEVFTAMAVTHTAATLRDAADQRYKFTHLKMQLAKAVSNGLISRDTLTKIRGLS
jgi:hypothetical protein